MNFEVGLIGAIMASDSAGDAEFQLPVTGGCYLLTGHACSDQTDHKDFEVREDLSTGFFVPFSRFEAIFRLVFPASNTHVYNQMDKKQTLAQLLSLEEASIPAYYIFVGYDYLQHRGCMW